MGVRLTRDGLGFRLFHCDPPDDERLGEGPSRKQVSVILFERVERPPRVRGRLLWGGKDNPVATRRKSPGRIHRAARVVSSPLACRLVSQDREGSLGLASVKER